MAHLAFVFVCIAWGTSFIALERLSHTFGPVEIAVWRLLTAAVSLGVIWWLRRDIYRWEHRYWKPVLITALMTNVPAYMVQPYLIGQGYGHSFFGIMVAAVPLVTILLSVPMLDEWPTGRQLVGVFGGLACLWLVVEDGVGRGMTPMFLALAFVIPLTSALNNTYVKWKLPNASALPVTATMLGSAGLMLLPLLWWRPALDALHMGPPAAPVGGVTPYAIVIFFGIFGTGLSTAAFFYMVLERGPLFAGMSTYVVPMLALAWGSLDHELISGRQLSAMAGVLCMVALVQAGFKSRGASPALATANAQSDSRVVTRPSRAAAAVTEAELPAQAA